MASAGTGRLPDGGEPGTTPNTLAAFAAATPSGAGSPYAAVRTAGSTGGESTILCTNAYVASAAVLLSAEQPAGLIAAHLAERSSQAASSSTRFEQSAPTLF